MQTFAGRYEYMRTFLLLSMILFSGKSFAWECGKIDSHYDLVAIVLIEDKSLEFEHAFTAKIEKIIFRYGEESEGFKDTSLANLSVGSKITLLEGPLKEIDDGSVTRYIKTDSCLKKYKVGTRVRIFTKQIKPNIFRSSSNWTKQLNENS